MSWYQLCSLFKNSVWFLLMQSFLNDITFAGKLSECRKGDTMKIFKFLHVVMNLVKMSDYAGTALFTIAQWWWPPKSPPSDEQLIKMWRRPTRNYYSALKKEWSSYTCYNMTNHENIMSPDVSQTQRRELCTIPPGGGPRDSADAETG